MFPFFGSTFFGSDCCSTEPNARRTYQERKLRFLKGMRDDLEARLAALNAAIEAIERQLSREDTAA